MKANTFLKRHNGPGEQDAKKMLKTMGLDSIEQLIDETVPKSIRLKKPLTLEEGLSEFEYLNHIRVPQLRHGLNFAAKPSQTRFAFFVIINAGLQPFPGNDLYGNVPL